MKTFEQLEAGQYYIPVFERVVQRGDDFAERYNTNSPIYQYCGEGEFSDESGESVDGFYDPELGAYVATNAADGFVQ